MMLDQEWSNTASAHDLDGTVAFYADNAVLLPPDEPTATDKAAIRASWAGTFSDLDTISWEVTKIEVARSGTSPTSPAERRLRPKARAAL